MVQNWMKYTPRFFTMSCNAGDDSNDCKHYKDCIDNTNELLWSFPVVQLNDLKQHCIYVNVSNIFERQTLTRHSFSRELKEININPSTISIRSLSKLENWWFTVAEPQDTYSLLELS